MRNTGDQDAPREGLARREDLMTAEIARGLDFVIAHTTTVHTEFEAQRRHPTTFIATSRYAGYRLRQHFATLPGDNSVVQHHVNIDSIGGSIGLHIVSDKGAQPNKVSAMYFNPTFAYLGHITFLHRDGQWVVEEAFIPETEAESCRHEFGQA